jgi:FtsZ-interacting cell division protein ZipA
MTDLQISLLAAGGVIVVGVLTYNKWQEYRARKSVERAFSGQQDDVLMRPDRFEPSLHDDVGPATGQDFAAASDADLAAPHAAPYAEPDAAPDAASRSVPDSAIGAQANRPRTVSPIDNLIDCVIPMTLEHPVAGEKLLPLMQNLRHANKKPVHSTGLAEDWEVIRPGSVYSALRFGVQMASRNAALNELEYSELVMQLRQLADQIGAEPDVPDMIDVMARARSLHQFVSEHDAQLGVNIQSNGAPWAMNTLLLTLEKQGFDVRPDGRFVMPDGSGGYLFGLSTNVTPAAETTSRLTLLLDVPCVSPEKDAFAAMVLCAKTLVTRLDGTIVDDSNAPLSDSALAQIAGQVQSFYEEMLACQIAPGSARALRLFS